MAAVDLVIFDCDGVLADSEVISARVLVREVAACGVSFDAAYVYRHFVGKSFPIVAGIIRERFKVDLPSGFEAGYRAALVAAFEGELRATKGVFDMLKDLGVLACVATSSSPPRVARTLEVLGLAERFGANVYTASQVARGKPAPDLFLFAAAEMGVAPGRCLVIEDSSAGVAAGIAAGMQVWRYVGGAHCVDQPDIAATTPSGVAVFDNWGQFYEMAPELRR